MNTKRVMLGFAVLGCVVVGALWNSHDAMQRTQVVAQTTALPQGAAIVRIARDIDAGTQTITLDAALARRAVRDGELHFALEDGSTYPVRIERNYTDATGHWNIVGRADTKLGTQPMVLTFGQDAVFGSVPAPDGRMLRITSGRNRVVSIAPAAGIVPAAAQPDDRDVLHPPQVAQPRASTPVVVASPKAPPPFAIAAAQASRVDVAAAAPAGLPPQPTDTAPQTIKLLVLFGQDYIDFRGSESAARTEIANLVALTNQAHIDSGSIARFDPVVQVADVSPTEVNRDVLMNAYTRYEDARDAVGADLVAIVRAHLPNDGTCGIAFTPNFSLQRRGRLYSMWSYSVTSLADGQYGCGPLVFPHELGHNLGAMHDRDTDRQQQTNQYMVVHGSYWFSSGYRTSAFSDIMAYVYGPQLPYFSSPRINLCVGKPCGVEDSDDVVRSFNLMASQIAGFRGTPGTLSIADSEAVEPTTGDWSEFVEVRLTGKAPVGGLRLQVAPAGGTAIEGLDYSLPAGREVFIPEGERVGNFTINVMTDAQTEDTEFALFNVSAQAGTNVAIEDAQARFDIIDRDARRERVTGRLWFPSNMPVPTQPIHARVTGSEVALSSLEYVLQPPDFAFALDVPHGSQLDIVPQWPDPYAMMPSPIEEVRGARYWNLYPQKGIRVSGTVRAAPGMVLPPTPFYLQSFNIWPASQQRDGRVTDYIEINAPDYSFSKRYPPNTSTILVYDNSAFARMIAYDWLPTVDVHHDLVLSNKPSLAAFNSASSFLCSGCGLTVFLSAPAPEGGVTYRCRFEDGTAKAGVDYIVSPQVVTYEAGRQGYSSCGTDLTVFANPQKRSEIALYGVIELVSGDAILTTARAPIRIRASTAAARTGGPGQADPAH